MRPKPKVRNSSASLDVSIRETLFHLYRRKAKLDRLIRRLEAARFARPYADGIPLSTKYPV
ncbi:MAG: hypothetical protein JOZ62_10595 [Acidobacteriaceae bacterium]|nr:hypothetical protein [Acidobacteriaceae bacterium]